MDYSHRNTWMMLKWLWRNRIWLACGRYWWKALTLTNQLHFLPRSQSTFLELFRVPGPCLAAILDCRTRHGMLWVLQETFLNDHLLKKGLSSSIWNNSKNLATSSQELRTDTEGNTKRPESEMRREPQHSSIPVPPFQSESGLLNHTGGTYSHSGVINYPRFPISKLHLGRFPDSMEFQSWKVNFKNWSMCKTSKSSSRNAMDQRSWDGKVNWRTYDIAIEYRAKRFPRLRYAWCDGCVCIEKTSRQACFLPKKE